MFLFRESLPPVFAAKCYRPQIHAARFLQCLAARAMSCTCYTFRPELLAEQNRTRGEKKKLRRVLREFEDDFLARTGRKVAKEDRAPRDAEYQEYKVRISNNDLAHTTYRQAKMFPLKLSK